MRKVIFYTLSMVLVMFMGACSEKTDEPVANEDVVSSTEMKFSKEDSRVATQVQSFNQEFFKSLVSEDIQQPTVVCSPLSASFILSILANASNDQLASEIINVLNIDNLDALNSLNRKYIKCLPDIDKNVTFKSANSVWYDNSYTINPQFSRLLTDYYSAPVYARDFVDKRKEVVNEVNNWARKNTEGVIEKIISEIPDSLVSLMANAIYFKGSWAVPFDKKHTRKMEFYGIDVTQTVDMMYIEHIQHYRQSEAYQAVKMQVGNGSYDVIIVLPTSDINDFIASEDFMTISSARFHDINIKFYLPRFKFEPHQNIFLNPILKRLGIESLETESALKMFEQPLKAANFIYQQAGVEFDEEGAKGAAVSFNTMVTSDLNNPNSQQIVEMKVDRPFVFMINETSTGAMLFAGKVGQI